MKFKKRILKLEISTFKRAEKDGKFSSHFVGL